ncbi:MAG: butyrate kinase [Candidatus Cloacimonetes bacterium]|jgi:butyrate kinase|nr:butyrate kinase [Candidatus Cloacimonadota bacterium]MDD3097037.1 butyrate kinase [Candidatus Cloacimonadota bacterium]MDD4033987.1 butyrate kinase [Candidatus Cloacimonadota bacterium]MDD4667374.1 butyrate kinase [Candidatus Cloacimonadota bacterium]MDY0336800.1 butyrate kinase [Candidatus Cloacimonadaceae bacterium]
MSFRVLAINPGSTSTKIAVFEDHTPLFEKTLRHDPAELDKYGGIIDQYDFRKQLVMEAMRENNVDPATLHAAVGRGGLVRPVSGGTMKISPSMLRDLKDPSLWGRIHASNLGAFIANAISEDLNIPAFIVDPVVVDEFDEIARISGIPEIERKSLMHALNIRYISRLVASDMGKKHDEANQIGVHMGGGISVAAIKAGRVVDVNNALLGMGSFSPQRAGALPIGDLLDLAYSGKYSKKELTTYLTKTAGLMAYLGTDSGIEVNKRIQEGDKKAELILKAMCYQVAKEIGACATVLNGKVDAIFLSGGLVYNALIVDEIKARTGFIAPIHLYPGEKEMEALCQGGIRVLSGLEEAMEYPYQ